MSFMKQTLLNAATQHRIKSVGLSSCRLWIIIAVLFIMGENQKLTKWPTVSFCSYELLHSHYKVYCGRHWKIFTWVEKKQLAKQCIKHKPKSHGLEWSEKGHSSVYHVRQRSFNRKILCFSEQQNRTEQRKALRNNDHRFFLLHECFLRIILGRTRGVGNNSIDRRFWEAGRHI